MAVMEVKERWVLYQMNLTSFDHNERYQYPRASPEPRTAFGGSLPPQGAGYFTLRSRLNGKPVQLGSLQRKLLKQPLVVHSHRKWTIMLLHFSRSFENRVGVHLPG